MRPSSARSPGKAVSSTRAHTAALINQFATPGLGSLMVGRWISGSAQLLLAVAGFILLTTWFFRVMTVYYRLMTTDAPLGEPNLHHELWKVGGVLFIAAWFWALVTSLSLLREARTNAELELRKDEGKPPVLTGDGLPS